MYLTQMDQIAADHFDLDPQKVLDTNALLSANLRYSLFFFSFFLDSQSKVTKTFGCMNVLLVKLLAIE